MLKTIEVQNSQQNLGFKPFGSGGLEQWCRILTHQTNREPFLFVKISTGKEGCREGLLGVDRWLGGQTIQCKTHCDRHLLRIKKTLDVFPSNSWHFFSTNWSIAAGTGKNSKVMATNLRNSIDEAVQSRVGETLQFSYPSASQCKQHYAAHAQLGRKG